jgi:hypothetical protein
MGRIIAKSIAMPRSHQSHAGRCGCRIRPFRGGRKSARRSPSDPVGSKAPPAGSTAPRYGRELEHIPARAWLIHPESAVDESLGIRPRPLRTRESSNRRRLGFVGWFACQFYREQTQKIFVARARKGFKGLDRSCRRRSDAAPARQSFSSPIARYDRAGFCLCLPTFPIILLAYSSLDMVPLANQLCV